MAKAVNDYKIFISYRRGDYPDVVEHIRSWFAWRYGRANVFMDFDSIPVGSTFPDQISEEIKACHVMLVIISPEWMNRIMAKPYDDDDWVRIEISEALKQEKLVVPVFIKGASIPDRDKLPPNLRGMLNVQGTWLDSGQNFIDRIETAISNIESLLAKKYSRLKEIRQMEEISPAAGLALGYYVNFIRLIGNQVVLLNHELRNETADLQLTIDGMQADKNRPVKMSIIIPHKLSLLQPDKLLVTSKALSRAEIKFKDSRRPLGLYAHVTDEVYELIDFPTTVAVLAHWIKRKLEEEGVNTDSEKAAALEEDELDRFTKALTYFIDDHSNDPLFRNYTRAVRYTPDKPAFKWLSDIFK